MKKPLFEGVCTAIVTPFHETGVNYDCLYKLIDMQLEAGVPAIVLCGTTGEASAMSEQEQLEVIEKGCRYIDGRMTVIAGTGSNNTEHAIQLSKAAESFGVDGLLIVTPYYNKASSKGLLGHYYAIADSVSIPLIVYNVPSRTGVNVSLQSYQALARHPRINGVKEASGDIAKVSRIIGTLGDDLHVWSGNDDQNTAITALGGKGAVSVLSNVCPELTNRMIEYARNGQIEKSSKLQNSLMPLIDALFCEVNPIPVKEALNMLGFEAGVPRLPLSRLEAENQLRLQQELEKLQLIV